MPRISKDRLLLHAGPVSHPESPLRDLVKVRMEMAYWSDREASINLEGTLSKFNLLCKRCQIKDISRWRATQEKQMEYFLMVLSL